MRRGRTISKIRTASKPWVCADCGVGIDAGERYRDSWNSETLEHSRTHTKTCKQVATLVVEIKLSDEAKELLNALRKQGVVKDRRVEQRRNEESTSFNRRSIARVNRRISKRSVADWPRRGDRRKDWPGLRKAMDDRRQK
jgi:hypothetical protein